MKELCAIHKTMALRASVRQVLVQTPIIVCIHTIIADYADWTDEERTHQMLTINGGEMCLKGSPYQILRICRCRWIHDIITYTDGYWIREQRETTRAFSHRLRKESWPSREPLYYEKQQIPPLWMTCQQDLWKQLREIWLAQ